MFSVEHNNKNHCFRLKTYKYIIVFLNNITMFSPLSAKMFSQSRSIKTLFTLFFSQLISSSVFLADPCS